jgi:hypothetical protein
MIDIEVDEEGTELFIVQCDECDEKLPPRKGNLFALLLASEAGWAVRVSVRKFSGSTFFDYCRKCRKEQT